MDFGPVTHPASLDSPDSPERSKSPVHFFFPPSLFGCELPPCLGSQLGSPELWWSVLRTSYQNDFQTKKKKKEKLRSEAAEKAFVSGWGKWFQFQLV